MSKYNKSPTSSTKTLSVSRFCAKPKDQTGFEKSIKDCLQFPVRRITRWLGGGGAPVYMAAAVLLQYLTAAEVSLSLSIQIWFCFRAIAKIIVWFFKICDSGVRACCQKKAKSRLSFPGITF